MFDQVFDQNVLSKRIKIGLFFLEDLTKVRLRN